MKKEFVTYDQALSLKDLGYNDTCFSFYNKEYTFDGMESGVLYESEGFGYNYKGNSAESYIIAPLIQQAFRFFREKYGLYAEILVDQTMEPKLTYRINKYEKDFEWSEPFMAEYLYGTYEKAEQACLDKLIELAKEKGK